MWRAALVVLLLIGTCAAWSADAPPTILVVELLPPAERPTMTVDREVKERTRQVLERRLDPHVKVELQEGPFLQVTLPPEADVEKAKAMILRPGNLDFREEKPQKFGKSTWVVVMDGKYLKDADVHVSEFGPEIALELTPEGTKRFAEITRRLVNHKLGIFFDDAMIEAPVIREPITGGSARISGGMMTVESCRDMVTLLKAGSLPVRTRIKSEGP